MCFCVLCNQEVSQKSYTRHIDKCFIRVREFSSTRIFRFDFFQFESQVSYGSNIKSTIEGLFCDNYDRTTNLYCKRLKVICPEHSRDPKVEFFVRYSFLHESNRSEQMKRVDVH